MFTINIHIELFLTFVITYSSSTIYLHNYGVSYVFCVCRYTFYLFCLFWQFIVRYDMKCWSAISKARFVFLLYPVIISTTIFKWVTYHFLFSDSGLTSFMGKHQMMTFSSHALTDNVISAFIFGWSIQKQVWYARISVSFVLSNNLCILGHLFFRLVAYNI